MASLFLIEDQFHAEHISEHSSLDAALQELNRLAGLTWDAPPNLAPCKSWRTCGRNYEIIEYDTSVSPWRELARHAGLDVSAKETKLRFGTP